MCCRLLCLCIHILSTHPPPTTQQPLNTAPPPCSPPSLHPSQTVLGVQAASDKAVAALIGLRLRQLMAPVYEALYPKGPSYGSDFERLLPRPSFAKDKDREMKVCVCVRTVMMLGFLMGFSQFQRSQSNNITRVLCDCPFTS